MPQTPITTAASPGRVDVAVCCHETGLPIALSNCEDSHDYDGGESGDGGGSKDSRAKASAEHGHKLGLRGRVASFYPIYTI